MHKWLFRDRMRHVTDRARSSLHWNALCDLRQMNRLASFVRALRAGIIGRDVHICAVGVLQRPITVEEALKMPLCHRSASRAAH